MSFFLNLIYSLAVPDDDDWVVSVEGDVVELGLLPGHDLLHADRVVLVDVQVKHVDLVDNIMKLVKASSTKKHIKYNNNNNLSIDGDGSEDGARVGRPGHVAHLGVQVEHEQGLPEIK